MHRDSRHDGGIWDMGPDWAERCQRERRRREKREVLVALTCFVVMAIAFVGVLVWLLHWRT